MSPYCSVLKSSCFVKIINNIKKKKRTIFVISVNNYYNDNEEPFPQRCWCIHILLTEEFVRENTRWYYASMYVLNNIHVLIVEQMSINSMHYISTVLFVSAESWLPFFLLKNVYQFQIIVRSVMFSPCNIFYLSSTI